MLTFTACEPALEEKIDIGNPPSVDFEYTRIDGNNISFTNTTNDEYFLVNWDFGSLGVFTTDNVDTLNFPLAGDYVVSLTVFGKGGSSTKTETINIAQDDPNGCNSIIEFLTGCSSKVWKLNPAAGALFVGPDLGTTWWANSASDVTTRDCDWNDRITFKANGPSLIGTFDYASQGDLWGETYMGFSGDGCKQIADLPADRAAWGDGTHDFEIIPGTPNQIKVSGLGAYLGLRKAANGQEVTHPQTSVTYDIVDMRTVGGVDIFEIQVNFGPGIWKFQLASE
jgi:PKD repeat protein